MDSMSFFTKKGKYEATPDHEHLIIHVHAVTIQ